MQASTAEGNAVQCTSGNAAQFRMEDNLAHPRVNQMLVRSILGGCQPNPIQAKPPIPGSRLSLLETIIQDYGALMERKPPLPTRIEDVSVLPHPKATILDALLFELGQGHSEQITEMLRIGAISLAQYRPGVGREPLEMLGADVSRLPETLAEARRLAPTLSKMQYRFKEFDRLVEDDLQRIKSGIAAAESRRRIRSPQQ